MDLGRVLVELLVVLVASRLAAEAAVRIRQPAVMAEIAAGLLIGPSVLGLAGHADALRLLGEIGLILLLFEVGRQMDLRELRAVGGSSMAVALIGVVVPMALGYPAMRAVGIDATPALFLAAAITATSVGITARVFGDLHALTGAEARIVLGAAVADDVAGLVVLTVVSRVATGGGVDAAEVATVSLIAVGFVGGATVLGALVVPRLLDGVSHLARIDGTVMVLGLALALGFARIAQAARLAPIVGAFVAGLAVGRSKVAGDLHRRLLPLGHFFIPIFFLQIGIDTQVRVFGNAEVLGIAAVLSVLAVAGKIVAGLGVPRGRANRLLVGVAMIPRGEVGLIFASIGLARGVLDARNYAVLLVVILVSTIVTPPWVRRLIERSRRQMAQARASQIEPEGGWLTVSEEAVELAAEPPPALAPRIGLDAASLCATRRPGPHLAAWLSSVHREPPVWDSSLRRSLMGLLRQGTERSWRFMDATGLLDVALPDVAAGLRQRPQDPFDLDGGAPVHPALLDGIRDVAADPVAGKVLAALTRSDILLCAALARDAFHGGRDPAARARRLASSIGLDHFDALEVGFLAGESRLLPAAAARLGLSEDRILDLASFVGSPERAGALYVLAVAENAMEPWERERLDELYGLVVEALGHPDLTGPGARDLVERRIEAVVGLMTEAPERTVRAQMMAAPRRYLLATQPETIARHIRMALPKPGRFETRIHAEPTGKRDEWAVHAVLLDRRGVLAAITGAFAAARVSVLEAQIATWRSGIAVDRFRVLASPGTDWDEVRRRIEAALAAPAREGSPAMIEGEVEIDNLASPWHSVVEVRAADRAGLLHRVADAMARAGVEIHEASVATRAGVAVDTFFVTGPKGGKLDAAGERALRAAFAGRPVRRLRRRRPGARAVS